MINMLVLQRRLLMLMVRNELIQEYQRNLWHMHEDIREQEKTKQTESLLTLH